MSTPTSPSRPAETALFATQGGGTALYDSMTNQYRWFELPDWMVALPEGDSDKAEVGDPLPKMWSVVPINQAARSSIDDSPSWSFFAD